RTTTTFVCAIDVYGIASAIKIHRQKILASLTSNAFLSAQRTNALIERGIPSSPFHREIPDAHSIAPRSSLQFTSEYALFIWKRKRRKCIGHFAPEISAATGSDHDKLPACFPPQVSDGSSMRARF